MSRKLLERLSGVGMVTGEDGTEAGPRKYIVTVWQEVAVVPRYGTTSPAEHPTGMTPIEAIVDFTSDDDLRSMLRHTYVLTLEDGRHLKFFIQNSDGRLVASGGLE